MDKRIKINMPTQEITLKEEELNDYIINNFKENALLEVSYNRVFIPGVILSIENDGDLVITMQLKGKLLNQTVNINLNEVKNELVELRYTYQNEITVIAVTN